MCLQYVAMISIIKHKKPILKPCEMVCDKPLHEKLNQYELTRFLNKHQTSMFLGLPRSGKTSTLYSLFKSKKLLKKVYHNIFIFQPSQSRDSMKDDLFGKVRPENIYEELDADSLDEVLEKIKAADPEQNNCLILDDVASALKDHYVTTLLKQIFQNKRHLHLSVFLISQSLFSIPKDVRKLFDNLFIFRISKNEMREAFDMFIENKDIQDAMEQIVKVVYDKPFQFMFINVLTGRIFKGFDELSFNLA